MRNLLKVLAVILCVGTSASAMAGGVPHRPSNPICPERPANLHQAGFASFVHLHSLLAVDSFCHTVQPTLDARSTDYTQRFVTATGVCSCELPL